MEAHHAHLLLALEQVERERGDSSPPLDMEDQREAGDAEELAQEPSTSRSDAITSPPSAPMHKANGSLVAASSRDSGKRSQEAVSLRLEAVDEVKEHLLQPPPTSISLSETRTDEGIDAKGAEAAGKRLEIAER